MTFEHTLFFILGAMSIIIGESILRLLVDLSQRGHRISTQGNSNNLLNISNYLLEADSAKCIFDQPVWFHLGINLSYYIGVLASTYIL